MPSWNFTYTPKTGLVWIIFFTVLDKSFQNPEYGTGVGMADAIPLMQMATNILPRHEPTPWHCKKHFLNICFSFKHFQKLLHFKKRKICQPLKRKSNKTRGTGVLRRPAYTEELQRNTSNIWQFLAMLSISQQSSAML